MIVVKPICLYCEWDAPTDCVIVTNDLGELTYVRYFYPQRVNKTFFNIMIPGEYDVQPKPSRMHTEKARVQVRNFTLPTPERTPPQGFRMSLRVADLHGTPARIDQKTGEIEVSPQFLHYPQFARLFIIQHELGHMWYDSEEKADEFAMYHFLKQGHNCTSALLSLKCFLRRSADKIKRIDSMFENLLINQK